MACLKGLTALVLTHVRLTPQVNVLFDAVAIAIAIFMHMGGEHPHPRSCPFAHPSGLFHRHPIAKTCTDISFAHSLLPRRSF